MKWSRQALRVPYWLILSASVATAPSGFAGGEPQEASRLPGVSGADNALQRSAAGMVWFLEALEDSECEDREIVNTEVLKLPRKPGRSPWTEKWTVDRCGEPVYYKITFTPTPDVGGTDFKVSRIEPK